MLLRCGEHTKVSDLTWTLANHLQSIALGWHRYAHCSLALGQDACGSSAEQQKGLMQVQAPLLHKLLPLICNKGGRPYWQQQLPRHGLFYGATPAGGQAGVATLQSRQAALSAPPAAALARSAAAGV